MKRVSNNTILKRLKKGRLCCPHCGSNRSEMIHGFAPYPEVWDYSICSNCGLTLAYADNSPWTTFLDEVEYLKSKGCKIMSLKDYRSVFYSFYNNARIIEKIKKEIE